MDRGCAVSKAHVGRGTSMLFIGALYMGLFSIYFLGVGRLLSGAVCVKADFSVERGC